MASKPIQLAVQFKGARYGGIYSVAGDLLIARIPGLDSRSRAVGTDNPEQVARGLFEEILADAARTGRLAG
jgi:hypothetical protein